MEQLQAQIGATPDSPEFGAWVVEYVKLQEQYGQEVKAENAGAIASAKTQLAESIATLVDSLNLVSLTGEPITRIVYEVTPGDGENGPTTTIAVNPKRITRRSTASGERAPREGQRDLKSMFEEKATDEDKAKLAQVEAGYSVKGEDYIDPESADGKKKLNSRRWALMNSVVNRS